MTREVFNILQEPVDGAYRALVAFCSKRASEMLLVVREAQVLEATGQIAIRTIEALGAYCVYASEWPGTRLIGGRSARVYHIPVTFESIGFVSNAVNSLYAWLAPALPEDLCFLRDDGTEILASISHEKDAYLRLSNDEYAELLEDSCLRFLNIRRWDGDA